MKLLTLLLSFFTLQYGVAFSQNQSKLIKIIGLIYFLLYISLELYNAHSRIKLNLIDFIGIEIFFICSFAYGFIFISKGKLIVDYIIHYINIFTPKQYIIVCLFISFLLINNIVHLIASIYPFNSKVLKTSLIFLTIFYRPYFYWISFSASIYGVMYFQMYLKHDRVLNQLFDKKLYTHTVIYKVFMKFKANHRYFDKLVSYFPALWLIQLFIGVNSMISLYSLIPYKLKIIPMVFSEIVPWIFVYLFINLCRSRLCEKIYLLETKVVLNQRFDETKLMSIEFLNRMAQMHVTACGFIKLDTSFILPFLGSLCTYTFLFLEKFK